MTNPSLNRAVFIFSILGMLVAGYLWFNHSHPQDIACGGAHDCETVALSPYSHFPVGWGPPVAMYGFFGYLIMIAVSLMRTLPGRERGENIRQQQLLGINVLVAALGAAFSLYLSFAEAFLIHAWCRWCVGSQVIILLLLALTVVEWVGLNTRKRLNAA